MTFKTYKTPAEARAAFMTAVNQRKVWEAEMRKRMEAMGILEPSVLGQKGQRGQASLTSPLAEKHFS